MCRPGDLHYRFFTFFIGTNNNIPSRLNRLNVSVYHAVPREETETVDFDQDGRSRVAVSFRMNGVESTSADV